MKAVKEQSSPFLSSEEAEAEPPSLYVSVNKTTGKILVNGFAKLSNPINPRSRAFIDRYFPAISDSEWNDWHWQLRNSYFSFQQLSEFLDLSDNEVKPSPDKMQLPVRITPYYASLLDPDDPGQALRRTMVPVYDEYLISDVESSDPLREEDFSPVPHLVHRYPDRVLFLITGFCAAYCRYCTRSHMVSQKEKCHPDRFAWDLALEYIRSHTEIRDVLLSGGDPLTLSDSRLEYLLSHLRSIPHVEIIRIGSKVPVVLPQRITKGLVSMLKKYHPLFMSIHFTHPDEITPEVEFACKMLADAGIPLGSQTVLLKDINDSPEIFKKLCHSLLKIRVRPYYLYQCDPIPGSSHFRTPVIKGLEIIRSLRGHTSGYAIPHFVIDAPGGGGKIPLLPEYIIEKNKDGYMLVNYEGRLFLYPESDTSSHTQVSS